jgi:predicted nucleotidyltransferase
MPRKRVFVPTQVSKLIRTLRSEANRILGKKLVALYVFGSVGMGDFSEHQSDVDFLVLLDGPLVHEEGRQLQEMHKKLKGLRFGDRLEGEYVQVSDLCPEGASGPVGRCENGDLRLGVKSQLSAENLMDLRLNAIVVCGPKPSDIVPAVSRSLVEEVLLDYLVELADELKVMKPTDFTWINSAVLNICRTLYTFQTERITSKSNSAKWALRTLPVVWRPIVNRSYAARLGKSTKDDEEFISAALPRFLAYALNYLQRGKTRRACPM